MLRQYGVLAFDIDQDGEPRFLLITSRHTRRWVIPRGNPIRGLSPARSAEQEAYEEAGVIGLIGVREVGAYDYLKRKKDGSDVPATVRVFPLRVTRQMKRYPERRQRETRWCSRAEAAAAVEEDGLRALLLSFDTLKAPDPDAPGMSGRLRQSFARARRSLLRIGSFRRGG